MTPSDEGPGRIRWPSRGSGPVVIAGPCAAESRSQLLEAARRMSPVGVHFLRAGAWKPRTRPNTFEGIGRTALGWLREAGETYGLGTATEVARSRHVEAAIEQDIDLLWLGARTTGSPFSVQEVAEALRGTDVMVLVKNPPSPDVDLWSGAIERLRTVGITRLGLVHRGFSMADDSPYRNTPMWELAIELRRRMPELPMICDPSHMAGRRDLIEDLCQRAMDLGMDGLMIEAHPMPDQAWSDAEQQVTPERAGQIIAGLRVPRSETDDPMANLSLQELRDTIDAIDTELLDVLASRMRVVDQIGIWKRKHNVSSLQLGRWNDLLRNRVRRAADRGVAEGCVKAIYEVIHREALRRQSEAVDVVGAAEEGAASSRGVASGPAQENRGSSTLSPRTGARSGDFDASKNRTHPQRS